MQQPRTFRGATLLDAYAAVREALGEDAVIIATHTRRASRLFGIGGHDEVEVVAAPPAEMLAAHGVVAGEPEQGAPQPAGQTVPFEQDAAAHDLVRAVAEAAAVGRPLGDGAPGATEVDESDLAPPFVNPMAGAAARGGPFDAYARAQADANDLAAVRDAVPRSLEATPFGEVGEGAGVPFPPVTPSIAMTEGAMTGGEAAGILQPERTASSSLDFERGPQSDGLHAAVSQLSDGLAEVRTLVERIALDRIDERIDGSSRALQQIRARLVEQGLGAGVLLPVLDRVADALTPDASAEAVRMSVERQLAAALPPVVRPDLTRRPATIVLAGPAGSGKTTMAMRLGLHLKQERGLRVTIAGTDVDRAGAPQQLEAYSASTGLAVRTCYTPGELQALLAEDGADVVIVDTAGHNGARRDRMTELGAFTQVARQRTLLLTVPATMKVEDLEELADAYRVVAPDGLVLTRLDETRTFGGALTIACLTGLGVAYTTAGEATGEAPAVADNHSLVAAMVAGAWAEPVAGGAARTAMAGGARRELERVR